jgi:hypothetical protein
MKCKEKAHKRHQCAAGYSYDKQTDTGKSVLFSFKTIVVVRKVCCLYSLHQTELAMNFGQVQVAAVDVIFITKGVQC